MNELKTERSLNVCRMKWVLNKVTKELQNGDWTANWKTKDWRKEKRETKRNWRSTVTKEETEKMKEMNSVRLNCKLKD
jgi:hypothetical protein